MMSSGRIEQICEQVKQHFASASQAKAHDDKDRMRAEAETAARMFVPVLTDAGDPLGMYGKVRAELRSFGFDEAEIEGLLVSDRSVTNMKKGKKQQDEKDKQIKHVQPPYIKPPSTLPGFPNAVPVRGKNGRKRWADKKAKRFYEWDYQHGHLEGWDNTGKKHQGAFNPSDGNQVKPPDPTKKPITPTMVTPMKKKEAYALAWYAVENDELVGEEYLKLSQDTVRKLFDLPEDEPAIYCYDVTASQRQQLMKLVSKEIDLNKYVYQLEGRA